MNLIELMTNREEEENTTELSKKFVEPLNIRKLNKGLELQVMHPLLLNLDTQENMPPLNKKPEESKQIQLSAANHEKSESIVVEQDIHQTNETKNSPLWSMYFDGSCTRTNTGASVWISNIEIEHTECISCRLKFQCSNNIAEYESTFFG